MPLRIVIDVRHIQDFGIGTYIRNLVRGFSRLNSEDHFFLIARPGDMGFLGGLGPNFEIVPRAGLDTGLSSEITFPFFLSRFAADLFHIPLNAVPYWMPRPYVVTVHDMSSLLYPATRDLRSALHEFRFRHGLLRAERVITVSAATRRDVENVIGIPPQRVRLIYSAPDPAFTGGARDMDQADVQHVLERYQISYPFILYAGTIRPQKNIPRLVEAFAVLRGELESHPAYSDLRLIIIGDEISRYPMVRQAVIKSRVEQAVRFLGFVPIDTLRVFYKAAVAFASPRSTRVSACPRSRRWPAGPRWSPPASPRFRKRSTTRPSSSIPRMFSTSPAACAKCCSTPACASA